jgi:hypothetical protein
MTKPGEKPYKLDIVWRNVVMFIFLHLSALYALTLEIKSPWAYIISKCLIES